MFGALVGGFISTLLTREHKISTFRQEWINNVREVLSEILTQGEIYVGVAYQDNEEAYREKVKLIEVIYKAKLFLNRNEDLSKTLIKKIETIPEDYFGKRGKKLEYANLKKELSILMQDLLKEEWKRVRDGELIWKANKCISEKGWPQWAMLSRLKLTIAVVLFFIAVLFGMF